MRFEATIGDRGEIVIPNEIREELKLEPETKVSVQVTTLAPEQGREPDWKKIDELVERLGPPMRAALLADGYASFDEYINDIRER